MQIKGWSLPKRERVASQVEHIRHWKVIEGDYTQAPDIKATWFIDPPYQKAGKYYPMQVDDYSALAEWCKARKGQVMVCENVGAIWLPFEPFMAAKSGPRNKVSQEALWSRCDFCHGVSCHGYEDEPLDYEGFDSTLR